MGEVDKANEGNVLSEKDGAQSVDSFDLNEVAEGKRAQVAEVMNDNSLTEKLLSANDADMQFPRPVSYLSQNFTLKGILEGAGVKVEDSVEETVGKLTTLLEKAQKGLCEFDDLVAVCGWKPVDDYDRLKGKDTEPSFTWIDFEGETWNDADPLSRTEILKGYNDQLVNQINAILRWLETNR